MFKDVINLIYADTEQDADGFPTETETKTEVFAEKKSITRNEFYTSMQAGLKPTIAFDVMADDFEMTRHMVDDKPVYAEKVEYDSVKYDIIRTYQKNERTIEIICG